jgi:signal transduction histidine kinase
VTLKYDDDAVALTVADDGRGFDAATVTNGFGLNGMRSRLEQVGGQTDVRSVLGEGTVVRVCVSARGGAELPRRSEVTT